MASPIDIANPDPRPDVVFTAFTTTPRDPEKKQRKHTKALFLSNPDEYLQGRFEKRTERIIKTTVTISKWVNIITTNGIKQKATLLGSNSNEATEFDITRGKYGSYRQGIGIRSRIDQVLLFRQSDVFVALRTLKPQETDKYTLRVTNSDLYKWSHMRTITEEPFLYAVRSSSATPETRVPVRIDLLSTSSPRECAVTAYVTLRFSLVNGVEVQFEPDLGDLCPIKVSRVVEAWRGLTGVDVIVLTITVS